MPLRRVGAQLLREPAAGEPGERALLVAADAFQSQLIQRVANARRRVARTEARRLAVAARRESAPRPNASWYGSWQPAAAQARDREQRNRGEPVMGRVLPGRRSSAGRAR